MPAKKEENNGAVERVNWRKAMAFLPPFPTPEQETLYVSSDRTIVKWAYREKEGIVSKHLRMMIKRSGESWQPGLGYPIATPDLLASLVGVVEKASWRIADMSELTDLPRISIDVLHCGDDAHALQISVDDWHQSQAVHRGQRLAIALRQLAFETGYRWVHHPHHHETLISVPIKATEVEALFTRLAPHAIVECNWRQADPSLSKPIVVTGASLVTAKLDFSDPLHLIFVDQQVWKNKRAKMIGSALQISRQEWVILSREFLSMGGLIVEGTEVQKWDLRNVIDERSQRPLPASDDDLLEVLPPDPPWPTMPLRFDIEASRLGVALDHDRLGAIRAETVGVSTLLGKIFAEDEDARTPIAAQRPCPTTGGHEGLDAKHSALLETLLTRPEWSLADYELVVRGMGLMPRAARDVLNDWSLDRWDEIFLEGGDFLVLNIQLLIEGAEE